MPPVRVFGRERPTESMSPISTVGSGCQRRDGVDASYTTIVSETIPMVPDLR